MRQAIGEDGAEEDPVAEATLDEDSSVAVAQQRRKDKVALRRAQAELRDELRRPLMPRGARSSFLGINTVGVADLQRIKLQAAFDNANGGARPNAVPAAASLRGAVQTVEEQGQLQARVNGAEPRRRKRGRAPLPLRPDEVPGGSDPVRKAQRGGGRGRGRGRGTGRGRGRGRGRGGRGGRGRGQ